MIEGFSTLYILECYSNDGGTLLYPSNLITIEKPKQSFIVEKTCVMINGWQTAHTIILFSKLIDNLLDALSKYSDWYSSTYEKVIILGGFNADTEENIWIVSVIIAILIAWWNSLHVIRTLIVGPVLIWY